MIIAANPRLLFILCQLLRCTGNNKIKFNLKSRNVTICEISPLSISFWRYYLSAVLVTTYVSQCILKKNEDVGETVVAWVLLIVLLVSQTYAIELGRKLSKIRDCINGVFQLDNILPITPGRYRKTMENLYVSFGYSLVFGGCIVPFGFVHALHWQNPCKATLAGYWLIPKCYSTPNADHITADFVVRLLVFLVNHWMYSFAINAAMFCISVMHTFTVFAIQEFIQRHRFKNLKFAYF